MDQAFTLRNLMSGRQGNPFAALSVFPRTQFLAPRRWQQMVQRLLCGLADRVRLNQSAGRILSVQNMSTRKSTLVVDRFSSEEGISRVSPTVYHVGAEKLKSRLDEELAEVIGLDRIWVALPFVENEEDLKWVSDGSRTILMHGTDEGSIVEAYRQIRMLSSRCGVKKVDTVAVGNCDTSDAARAHARLVEMGNRFLQMEFGFLGKLKLNPEEYLIHLNAGDDLESRLGSIAEDFRLEPAQNAHTQ